jgi:hypothetical protein
MFMEAIMGFVYFATFMLAGALLWKVGYEIITNLGVVNKEMSFEDLKHLTGNLTLLTNKMYKLECKGDLDVTTQIVRETFYIKDFNTDKVCITLGGKATLEDAPKMIETMQNIIVEHNKKVEEGKCG